MICFRTTIPGVINATRYIISRLFGGLAASSVAFSGAVTAENLTHSNWTVNISEGDLPSPPRVAGDQPEIAVVGKTVHILFYRRSRDNGKTMITLSRS